MKKSFPPRLTREEKTPLRENRDRGDRLLARFSTRNPRIKFLDRFSFSCLAVLAVQLMRGERRKLKRVICLSKEFESTVWDNDDYGHTYWYMAHTILDGTTKGAGKKMQNSSHDVKLWAYARAKEVTIWPKSPYAAIRVDSKREGRHFVKVFVVPYHHWQVKISSEREWLLVNEQDESK